MSTHTVISGAELLAHIDDPSWVAVDCRHSLISYDYGRTEYAKSHIPGSVFFDVETDLAGVKTGKNGRHPLPSVDTLVQTLQAAGIGDDTFVVAYDDANLGFAARLWFLLRLIGHENVAVLDGGWKAWNGAGYPVSEARPSRPAATFTPKPQPMVVDAGFVGAQLDSPNTRLLDARTAERHMGINETIDPVGGHIPGARNRFHQENLSDAGLLKSPEQLRADFSEVVESLAPSQIVHFCGSGVTACLNLLAMEHAGMSGSRVYAGSWSEWCANPARPIAR
ncbi:MAG: sulfurtransferase [Candidatus Baltobacteraceae bacterium]